MANARIYLSSPTMNGKEMGYVKEAFDTNWVAPLGKNVNEFENELVSFVGSKAGAALCSGTAAIHLALKAAGVSDGDDVVCPTLTFSATCNPVLYLNANPIFVDSELDSWNMDPNLLRKALKAFPNVKAVLAVNLYGTPAKLDEISDICEEYHVVLIEDAAESLGASYHGKQTGTFGTFGIFSFNGNKIITTSGGGMLVSTDVKAIEKARFWSTQSREPARHYEHKEIGYNYRMSNIVAGIGRGQLHTLKEYIQRKHRIYQKYQEAFAEIPEITMNPILQDCEANYWLSCITLAEGANVKPTQIMDALEVANIEARPIWKPMHLQPVFAGCHYISDSGFHIVGDGHFTVAEDIFLRGLCLPSDIKNTDETMEEIIGIVKSLFK